MEDEGDTAEVTITDDPTPQPAPADVDPAGSVEPEEKPTPPADDPQPAKSPLPDAEALAVAVEEVRKVFEPEFKEAGSDAEKTALAKRMIEVGLETADLPTRFALFLAARNLAVSNADVPTAFAALDAADATFDDDLLRQRARVLRDVSEQTLPTKEHEPLAKFFTAVIDDAVSRDRFEVAQPLAEMALASARKSRNTDLIRGSVQRRRDVQELAEAYAEVAAAIETLKTDPMDAEANLIAGKYYCFVRADWAKGLPLLALGSDERLGRMADQEADPYTVPTNLGDDWWEIAEQLEGQAAVNVKIHAAQWYERTLPSLTGLAKTAAEKRLQEAQQLAAEALTMPSGALLVMTFDQGTIVSRGGKVFVNDLSGKGNHGEVNGAILTDGKVGKAMQFDGQKDFIHLPSLRSHLIKDLNGITVCAWIRPLDEQQNFVFDVGYYGSHSVTLVTQASGIRTAGQFYVAGGDGCPFNMPLDGQWHHIAATWGDGHQRVYIDGSLAAGVPRSGFALNSDSLTQESARIGSQAKSEFRERNRFFGGAIDEFAIFGRALSAEEIRTLYQMGRAGKPLAK